MLKKLIISNLSILLIGCGQGQVSSDEAVVDENVTAVSQDIHSAVRRCSDCSGNDSYSSNHLTFVTPAQNIMNLDCSSIATVQLQNSYNQPISLISDVVVCLFASSPVTFYSDAACAN